MAVEAVAKAIRREVYLCETVPRPLGRFLVVGQEAKIRKLSVGLARSLFGDESAMLWLDMNRYSEKHRITALVARNGGLARFYFEGELTDAILQRPQTVVVLAGVDQAHPDIWRLLSCILEEASLIDGIGRTICFKNAIVIATTTVGCAAAVASPANQVSRDTVGDAVERKIPADIFRLFSDGLILSSRNAG
jgi:ATP-dependent Clp protease ATP-binding subunit ClpA